MAWVDRPLGAMAFARMGWALAGRTNRPRLATSSVGVPPQAPIVRVRDRFERGSVLIVIIAIHLMVLLWLITHPSISPSRRDPGPGLVLVSISPGKRPATPPTAPKPPPPIPLPPPPVILPSVLPIPAAAQNIAPAGLGAPQPGDAGGCALATRTAEAIVADPAAMAELAALPPSYRTLADAVMLWNGEWLTIAPGLPIAPATGSLRRVVEQVVAEASPDCRAAPTNGPQFLAIPEPGRTTTLVIGSGTWRWSDLVTLPAACSATAPGICLPAPLAR